MASGGVRLFYLRIRFMQQRLKKYVSLGSKALAVVVLGAVGALIANWYVAPKLAAYPSLSKYGLFRKATENTTIINKTEQVVVREDDSVEKVAFQAAPTVVDIVSVAEERAQEKTATKGAALSVPQSLAGSGVLVTNDGLVATYRKALIEKDASYTVLLYNGTSHPAELVGIDNLTNLAYLRIQASNVPAIAFSDSDDMRPGKKLIAVANSSEAYQNRFSNALLSGIDRAFNLSEKVVASSEKWEGVFEVDFPGQKDYLGAPVINFNGELVGLVGESDLDNRKQYFLLPANAIKKSLESVIRGELDRRPYLGLYYMPITKEFDLTAKVGRDRGALVYAPSGKSGLAVIAGSPAEKAGLQVNDIIIAVNGREIDLSNPLSVALSRFSKGESVELTILRGGDEKKVPVQL
jgi:S1-C subfamily serine protease